MSGANPMVTLVIYSLLVLVASLAGGWLPLLVRLTHARLQMAISFVAGLMLGLALLHFIPDSEEQLHSLNRTMAWALAGFLVMFFLQRFLHYHHHDVPEDAPDAGCCHHAAAEHHEHKHHHPAPAGQVANELSWVGATLGLTLHSLLDGIALGAAVSIGTQAHSGLIGLGTALAVILHKPFDSMAISTLMAASGQSRVARQWLNVIFALVAPVGILLIYFGASRATESNPIILGSALGFCAGTFLCIACSDLLPELQFHSHDRLWLSLALLAGLGVAILILQFESSEKDPPHSQICPQYLCLHETA
jgi:zinc and cadmium transporter